MANGEGLKVRFQPMSTSNKEKRSRDILPQRNAPAAQSEQMPPPKQIGPGPVSISEVVNRLEELVKFALECEGKELKEGVSVVDVFKQLEEVRFAIDMLNKDQQELLTLFSSVTGGAADVNKSTLSEEDKKVIDKLKHLQAVCEAAKERMYVTIKSSPETESIVNEQIKEASASEKKKVIQRKGKFRPLGGKEGWVRT